MKYLFFLLAAICLLPQAFAQTADPLVVMNLAAHPDDEDGRTLTYYRHAKNAVAYSVIYTRGEGGQNEIGPELYEALGAIRTEETEKAARILGTQVFFLNFKDFGYSKKASETFNAWGGEDHVTAELVYLIRKLKPDVMFTNHDTLTVGVRVQHGHHQAVGISAYKAFQLAADPTFHPEQLEEEGVDLWQPSRLFLRIWRRTNEPYDVRVPVTQFHEETNQTHSERASEALAEHASQGMGMFAGRRVMQDDTYFNLLASAISASPDSLDLAGNLWPNRAHRPNLAYWIDSGRLTPLPEEILSLDRSIANPGTSVTVSLDASKLGSGTLAISGATSQQFSVQTANTSVPLTFDIPLNTPPTLPAITRQYERIESHPPIQYTFTPDGSSDIQYAGHLPLHIAKPFVVASALDVIRLKEGQNEIPISVQIYRDDIDELQYEITVKEASETTATPLAQGKISTKGQAAFSENLQFKIEEPVADGDYVLSIGFSERSMATNLLIDARAFSTKIPQNLHVGVVESYDNTLALALDELGVKYTLLDSTQLASGSFQDIQTVLVDIRAYLVREDLRAHNGRLLDWVENGGHLIVNYHKTMEWNTSSRDVFMGEVDNPQFAPYPLLLSRDRVTREDAPVVLLEPEHLLFHWPNTIDNSVWEGWVQERGLYFPGEYDEAYTELFSMHDPGEDALTSSTLLASYGKGTYLYTALGWYRQLKNFNPGVYDFFANMISMPLVQEGPMIP